MTQHVVFKTQYYKRFFERWRAEKLPFFTTAWLAKVVSFAANFLINILFSKFTPIDF